MFVRMLTVHCDQNDSYEITNNGFQVSKNKRNDKRNNKRLLLRVLFVYFF